MEGDPEDSDEDLQGSTVLWEKCIEQSIFVDLSEDESLHFSDLEGLTVHLSEAESAASEASIHLSGSAELSALDDTSSESSIESSQREKVVEDQTKSSILNVSAQRPNTMQDDPPVMLSYEDQNTSDEDQEDLPYDGDPDSPCLNQTVSTEGNTSSDGKETIHGSPEVPGVFELTTPNKDSPARNADKSTMSQKNAGIKRDASKSSSVSPPRHHQTDINQLLLQHFSQEELLQPGRLIAAETLPEVSLLESMDDTILSLAPVPSRSDAKSHAASKKSSLQDEAEIDNVESAADSDVFCMDSNQSSGDNCAVEVKMQDKSGDEDQVQRVPLVRARSFSEMKYGQGQVHYPRPDFSKVVPKVKIPKAPSGPARTVPQSPSTMHRTQSSPGMLEVISRVLEDSVQQPERMYVFRGEERQTPPTQVHRLQAEYDKLLTKYAEAENLIDQMRIGTNTQLSSELMLYSECDDHQRNSAEGSHLGSLAPRLPTSETSDEKGGTVPHNTKEANTASSNQPEEAPSEGDRMTAELTDIICPFTQKVEEFKVSVINMLISTAEQQMVLRSMMEAQDQLERKYISKKEEHRALEMQNYMGLSRNTGTFDPDRQVEGDIFRIGMHLDDIKEIIDKNMSEQISPPYSSSTPTRETRHVNPTLLTPSPPPSLHEGLCGGISTASCDMDTWTEGDRVEEASEVHGDGGLEQSIELMPTDFVFNNTGNTSHSWSAQGSAGRADAEDQRAEDEDGRGEERSCVSSEGIVHSDIIAYLTGASSSLRQTEWTPESASIPVTVHIPEGECDQGDCVSLAVVSSSSDTCSRLEHPLNTSCESQRIVSPETDSGFGSSYLTQSAFGKSQPNLLIESSSEQSHHNGLSSSDSEGSCSNLETTVHSASPNIQRWARSQPSIQTQASGAVDLWVAGTTMDPSVIPQGLGPGPSAQLSHYVSEPVLSTSIDTGARGGQMNPCSCNSEAILALQSEVSRLKKNLEEGLVQLPHLAQKMDYLTSKYRDGYQERSSKPKHRTQQRPACNSPAQLDDWISSDMDPSKSKGTDSGDTAASEIMLQFHNSPVGSRRGSTVFSRPAFPYKLQGTLQSSRVPLTSAAAMESLYSRKSWSPLSSPSLQRPLLQVSYGSSSSLPASYKVKEPQLMTHHRKRSTQSDTALLPSNVYFQRTRSPVLLASTTVSRTGRHTGSKEDEMNKTLDEAIEVARSLKRTTDRMAKKLSADLAKAQRDRKLHHTQPLGARKHQTF